MSIVIQESVKNSIVSGDSFLLPSWSPQANELVLVQVSMRGQSIVPALSGNGLTFVEVARKDDVQGVGRVILFRGMSASPSSGQITVTVTGNTKPVAAIAIRVSGVDTSGSNGSGAIEAIASAEVGSVDNNDLKVDITTLSNGARAVAVSYARLADITLPSGENPIEINYSAGSGGDNIRASTWYEDTPTAGTITLGGDNSLSSNREWAVIVVSIKPGGVVYAETVDITLSTDFTEIERQNYIDAGNIGQAVVMDESDLQNYTEDVNILAGAQFLISELQSYIEFLDFLDSQLWESVDIQIYSEQLDILAEMLAEITDRQTYREDQQIDLSQVWEAIDELAAQFSEVLEIISTQAWAAADHQTYGEIAEISAGIQATGTDLQSYIEKLEAIAAILLTIADQQNYLDSVEIQLQQTWQAIDDLIASLPAVAQKTFFAQMQRQFESSGNRRFIPALDREFPSEAKRKFESFINRKFKAN